MGAEEAREELETHVQYLAEDLAPEPRAGGQGAEPLLWSAILQASVPAHLALYETQLRLLSREAQELKTLLGAGEGPLSQGQADRVLQLLREAEDQLPGLQGAWVRLMEAIEDPIHLERVRVKEDLCNISTEMTGVRSSALRCTKLRSEAGRVGMRSARLMVQTSSYRNKTSCSLSCQGESEVVSHLFGRLSLLLQRGNTQLILARTPTNFKQCNII